MKTRRVLILLSVLLIMAFLVDSQASAQWGRRDEKNTSLSVFAAIDNGADQSGYGASLTKRADNGGITGVTYIDFESYRLIELSQLAPKQFGMFATNLGFAAAYADPQGETDEGPDGVMTGLALILSEKELGFGLGLDIRASALSKGVDPISWIADPDIFWIGAGLSYKF